MNYLLYGAMTTIWGASFFFTAIALDAVNPSMIVLVRLALAAVALNLALLVRGRRLPRDGAAVRHLLILGALNIALPFTLLTWAQVHVNSSTTVVLSATTPVFVFLLAERFDALRLGGIVLSFLGIAALAGLDGGGAWHWQLVIVATSLIFAAGNVYTGRFLSHLEPPVIAAGQLTAGAVLLLPVTVASGNFALPALDPMPLLAVLELGLLGSAAGYLLYFRFIQLWGSTMTSLNTYLQPAVGLLLGVLVLGEAMSARQWLSLGVILLGLLLFGWASVRAGLRPCRVPCGLSGRCCRHAGGRPRRRFRRRPPGWRRPAADAEC